TSGLSELCAPSRGQSCGCRAHWHEPCSGGRRAAGAGRGRAAHLCSARCGARSGLHGGRSPRARPGPRGSPGAYRRSGRWSGPWLPKNRPQDTVRTCPPGDREWRMRAVPPRVGRSGPACSGMAGRWPATPTASPGTWRPARGLTTGQGSGSLPALHVGRGAAAVTPVAARRGAGTEAAGHTVSGPGQCPGVSPGPGVQAAPGPGCQPCRPDAPWLAPGAPGLLPLPQAVVPAKPLDPRPGLALSEVKRCPRWAWPLREQALGPAWAEMSQPSSTDDEGATFEHLWSSLEPDSTYFDLAPSGRGGDEVVGSTETSMGVFHLQGMAASVMSQFSLLGSTMDQMSSRAAPGSPYTPEHPASVPTHSPYAQPSSTFDAMSPAPVIPSNTDYPGPHHFEVTFQQSSTAKSATWTYSPLLKKLYCQIAKTCPIQIKVSSPPPPGTAIRAMPVYKKAEHVTEVVKRCPNHELGRDFNEGQSAPASHLIRVEGNSLSQYVEDPVTGRQSVLVPYEPPQVGTEFTTILYNFMCNSSCVGGMNRRPILIIITLEARDGQVLGRRSFEGRICACPGRDRKADEDHCREQQALNESAAKSGAASKRAFKQSPPAIPALGAGVKKRRHGEEDVFYMHVRGRENFEILMKVKESLELMELVPQQLVDSYRQQQQQLLQRPSHLQPASYGPMLSPVSKAHGAVNKLPSVTQLVGQPPPHGSAAGPNLGPMGPGLLNNHGHALPANGEMNGAHSSQPMVSGSHCTPPPPYHADPSLVRCSGAAGACGCARRPWPHVHALRGPGPPRPPRQALRAKLLCFPGPRQLLDRAGVPELLAALARALGCSPHPAPPPGAPVGGPGGPPGGQGPDSAPRRRSRRLPQDLGALKIPDQYRMTIWRGLQDLKQGHDYGGAPQLIRSSSNAATISIGSSGELQRQRVMEAVHFRVRHTITIPNRGAGAAGAGPDEWADFGFDLPDCKSRRQPIKEELPESEIH
ncbi:Tumor protein p73, partial [Galemys pyrenaicus]